MLVRFEDWPERLDSYFAARLHIPFDWGFCARFHDCCTFAAGAVIELTGVDLMTGLRGYRTAEQAGRILAPGLEHLMDERLPRIASGFAGRGDLVTAPVERRTALLVVDTFDLVGPGANGLVRLPRHLAQAAWRV